MRVRYCYCLVQAQKVIKKTRYSFDYIRGLREWKLTQEKCLSSIFQPMLLSPCQPEKFQFLKQQCQIPVAMLLCIGDHLPQFKATFLGNNQLSYEQPMIFVYWKLEGQKSMIKNLVSTARTIQNRFIEQSNEMKHIETAYSRAKTALGGIYQVVGLITDIEHRSQYEAYVQPDESHILLLPEDEAFDAFQYAEEPEGGIRSVHGSVFLFNQNVFYGCYGERFSDPQFANQLHNQIQEPVKVIKETRFNKFKQQIGVQQRRDDYQKVKNIIKNKLKEYTQQMDIGDTFKLEITKETYYYNFQKVGATYYFPTLKLAGSPKHSKEAAQLMEWIKNQTPIAHMLQDLKPQHTFEKSKLMQKLCTRLSEQYDDLRFILEKSMTIQYDPNMHCFIIDRNINSIHNAPLPVSAAFQRKEELSKIGKEFFIHQDTTYSHIELRLLKGFFNNPYGVSTSFNVGSIYSPIPNSYCITHHDQSVIHQDPKPLSYPKGIFESKVIGASLNQSLQIPFPEVCNVSSHISEIQGEVAEWEMPDVSQDIQYSDCIIQKGNEVLVIYLLDYVEQGEQLAQLLDFTSRQQWTKDQVRVIGLSRSAHDHSFEISLNKYRLDRWMSTGIFEPWFPIKLMYMATNFNKMLNDLYGLNQKNPILVIDQVKRLVFRGTPDRSFAPSLIKIVNGDVDKTIHPADHSFKHRLNLAQYEQDWKILKHYGQETVKFSSKVKELLQHLQVQPLNPKDLWQVKCSSFQLWNNHGKLIRKLYERPQIIYRFERQELGVKFHNVIDEIIALVGQNRIEIIDLQKQTNQPLEETLK